MAQRLWLKTKLEAYHALNLCEIAGGDGTHSITQAEFTLVS